MRRSIEGQGPDAEPGFAGIEVQWIRHVSYLKMAASRCSIDCIRANSTNTVNDSVVLGRPDSGASLHAPAADTSGIIRHRGALRCAWVQSN